MRQVKSAVAAFNYFNMYQWILKNQKKKKMLALYVSWIKIRGKIHSNYILVSESKRKVITTLKGNKICTCPGEITLNDSCNILKI